VLGVRSERQLTVTLTHPSAENPITARLRFTGSARAAEARGTVRTHADPAPANTFADPEAVRPAHLKIEVAAGAAAVTLPRQSVGATEIRPV
jgi:hypothetical protein